MNDVVDHMVAERYIKGRYARWEMQRRFGRME